ncbi:MAG: transposase [Chloroflexi bacterium]|nr:transposase [Chloroflexota bacterium]
MKKDYILSVRCWSKRFVSLLPLSPHHLGTPAHLPRFMCADDQLPRFVQECPTTMAIIPKLRLLAWETADQPACRQWFGKEPIPSVAYIGAFLVKIDQRLASVSHLRRFLVQHPALVWALGFPLYGQTAARHGFDPEMSLPSRQQFSRMLRELDNKCLQAMLTAQVSQLQSLLPEEFGRTVSLDTKHVLAWVKENNPRQYIKKGRYDKTKQPTGDADCKLGCKKQHNRLVTTPAKEGLPAETIALKDKEFYWGYASGAVVTKLSNWGEFVLAEMTQTFDTADVRYFFPLMEQVEKRLGFRPLFAALDAAFDAFYVYEYFHNEAHDGFVAVPLKQPNSQPRQFDAQGQPLCAAALPMPVRKLYTDNTKAIMSHQRAIHACPLLHPEPTGATCPIAHKQWSDGGCTVNLPVGPGARLRYQLDRKGDAYQRVYAQRTAVERIFSQAKSLGIERPKLRNQQAIANQNTMIYLLINLRSLQQVLTKLSETE